MNNLFYKITLLLFWGICSNLFAQTGDWEYIGIYKDNDVYYMKSSVVRGDPLMVVVVLKPQFPKNDTEGNPYKYITVMLMFHMDSRSTIRCLISNRIVYYDDKTYKKLDFPKLDVTLDYHETLKDLYNKIK